MLAAENITTSKCKPFSYIFSKCIVFNRLMPKTYGYSHLRTDANSQYVVFFTVAAVDRFANKNYLHHYEMNAIDLHIFFYDLK